MTAGSTVERSSLDALAARLDAAWQACRPVPPLSESEGLRSPDDAYAVQERWSALRAATCGERIVGRKIGLTSRAMQQQMGVDQPDYGSLWESRYFPSVRGRAEVPTELLVQPRTEGEIAFLIGRPLAGPGVTAQQVMAATEALATAVEVIDSRIQDWRITLADTIADNASFGALTLGQWSRRLRYAELRTLGMLVSCNGEPVVEGVGAAALGHPARAVAWLANTLGEFGVALQPGDIVLSGSLGRSVPSGRGDVFTLEMHDQPPLTVTFA